MWRRSYKRNALKSLKLDEITFSFSFCCRRVGQRVQVVGCQDVPAHCSAWLAFPNSRIDRLLNGIKFRGTGHLTQFLSFSEEASNIGSIKISTEAAYGWCFIQQIGYGGKTGSKPDLIWLILTFTGESSALISKNVGPVWGQAHK